MKYKQSKKFVSLQEDPRQWAINLILKHSVDPHSVPKTVIGQKYINQDNAIYVIIKLIENLETSH